MTTSRPGSPVDRSTSLPNSRRSSFSTTSSFRKSKFLPDFAYVEATLSRRFFQPIRQSQIITTIKRTVKKFRERAQGCFIVANQWQS